MVMSIFVSGLDHDFYLKLRRRNDLEIMETRIQGCDFPMGFK